eukprot:4313343-Prymnesium_polylepis.1
MAGGRTYPMWRAAGHTQYSRRPDIPNMAGGRTYPIWRAAGHTQYGRRPDTPNVAGGRTTACGRWWLVPTMVERPLIWQVVSLICQVVSHECRGRPAHSRTHGLVSARSD